MSFPWAELGALGDRRAGKRTWSRRLGFNEAAFYWNAVINGGTDVIQHLHVRLHTPHLSLLEDRLKVENAWISTKFTHPMLAASAHENSDDPSDLKWSISEERIHSILPDEVKFTDLQSSNQLTQVIDDYSHGPRKLTNDGLARLEILSLPLTSTKANHRDYHIIMCNAHAIADGPAAIVGIRTFLEILTGASGPHTISHKRHSDVAKTLTMVPSVDDLYFPNKITTPRQRWRSAAAMIILQLKGAKRVGGHTIPNKITRKSLYLPCLARQHNITLDKATTEEILSTCHKKGITFNHAATVLCQVAHSSLLHSLHSSGKLSTKEFKEQAIQPTHLLGPINIRPYLSEEWVRRGGMKQVLATGCGSICTLPFMSSSLSADRFFHRCRMIQKQMDNHLQHPLLLEMSAIMSKGHLAERRPFAMKWRDVHKTGVLLVPEDEENPDAESQKLGRGVVVSNMVSTFGSITNLTPFSFPNEKQPALTIISLSPVSRPPPAQFYLTIYSQHDCLTFICYWDGNAYEDSIVTEWTEKVVSNARTYLTCGKTVTARL